MFTKGAPRPANAGRKPGSLNKSTIAGKERLERYAGEMIELHYAIATNNLECGVCRGKGKTMFQSGTGKKPGMRTCQSCWGSGKERIDPGTRQDSADSLLDRSLPKLKAIEHSGSDDKPPIGVRVILVKASE